MLREILTRGECARGDGEGGAGAGGLLVPHFGINVRWNPPPPRAPNLPLFESSRRDKRRKALLNRTECRS